MINYMVLTNVKLQTQIKLIVFFSCVDIVDNTTRVVFFYKYECLLFFAKLDNIQYVYLPSFSGNKILHRTLNSDFLVYFK